MKFVEFKRYIDNDYEGDPGEVITWVEYSVEPDRFEMDLYNLNDPFSGWEETVIAEFRNSGLLPIDTEVSYVTSVEFSHDDQMIRVEIFDEGS